MRRCGVCRALIDVDEKVGFRETCPKCGAYLHSCINCRFYAPGKYNDCAEPSADRVTDKEGANFCEYFRFKED